VGERHRGGSEQAAQPFQAGFDRPQRLGGYHVWIETEIEDGEAEEGEEGLVAEALEEHQEVKALIAALRAMDPGDAQFQAKFDELRQGVEEHVGMEEDELMSDAVAALGGELERLGRQLEERKGQLMAGRS
jgi:hypothetical protein